MFWLRRKRKELDDRTEQARTEAAQAAERLHRTREEVVKPLRRAAAENRFAALIRESLLNGGHR